jgi:hypothetical protein
VATWFIAARAPIFAQKRGDSPDAPKKKSEYATEVFSAAPSNYDDLIDTATLVVRIHIVQSQSAIIQNPRSYPSGWTVHTAEVLETIKGRVTTHSIRFMQRAAKVETDALILTAEGHEPLLIDHDYVVFLMPQPNEPSTYRLAFEREGVFSLEDGAVRPFGFSETAHERRGIAETTFMHELRDRVAHSQGVRR